MAGGKQTPRQKLIGLMYLIFLALMALNVSVEVLDSFPLINKSIEETNKNFEMKVDDVYDDFYEQRAISEDLVRPYFGEAMYLQGLADSLVSYIQTNRTEMLARVNNISFEEADTLDLMDSKAKDNYSTSSRFWLVENIEDPAGRPGGPGSRAYALREKIAQFTSKIDSILNEHDQAIALSLDVEGPFYVQDRQVTWQQLNFDRVISVAVATNLSRLITEVRNAEFDAISMLFDLITAGDFRFDEIAARVVPNSQIVMQGDHFEADIFVAAYDTRMTPEVIVDGRRIPVTEGVGKLRIPATTTGSRTHSGVIRVTSPAGITQEYPFSTQYTVERPTATVSADAMNVFYIGVDNPVSISAPGVATENLRPTISSGGELIRQRDGSYIVRMQPGTREATVNVRAVIEGETRTLGTSNFRVRTFPDPVAYIAGRRDGRVSRDELVLARAIIPRLEGFEFDMNFEIASFTMATTIAGDFRPFRGESNQLTPEMIQVIENATRGQRIIFENITTKPGPDGRTRTLPPISLTIN